MDDFITEIGEWGIKWLYPYINGWVPGALFNVYPDLKKDMRNDSSLRNGNEGEIHAANSESSEENASEINRLVAEREVDFAEVCVQDRNDMVTLDLDSDGRLFAKCQVTDYRCCRHELTDWNMMDFFVHTYTANRERCF
ncbi:hypothetical protein B0H10DRAFT_2303291 [Mycena sp. CBHHK59/15]|nr:hypothetical protein B0H10DRAFT_2303291 [Mycena sp. CBHHK59/15]